MKCLYAKSNNNSKSRIITDIYYIILYSMSLASHISIYIILHCRNLYDYSFDNAYFIIIDSIFGVHLLYLKFYK